ncbi:MAG: PTS glucose transporter subunit IIA [Lactobacillales bacterium]|jgi:glucose-specific phosphotransferase system IIA component|nr:PTS glucose transporter subunit IIA [Lactobacillales bacterium]
MFGFKKKTKLISVGAIVSGKIIPMTEVRDEVFSQKMLGDGFAVLPVNGEIVAPMDGTIVSIFPTKHALTMKTTEGLELILHLGIDTVSLNGEPFEMLIHENEEVSKGQPIAQVDLSILEKHALKNEMIVVFTNLLETDKLQIIKNNASNKGEEVVDLLR